MTASEVPLAVLSLGSNLGERLEQLKAAAQALAQQLEGATVSPVYRSLPEGGEDQPDYLNAVIQGGWRGSPRELLNVARRLEEDAGRVRPYVGAPRTLDVDLIFVGAAIVRKADLQIPHPRWKDRPFVLVPLLTVAPTLQDPETGLTVAEAAEANGWTPESLERVASAGELLPVHPEAK